MNNIYKIETIETANGVRAIACMSVVILHAMMQYLPTLGPQLGGLGQYGVWVFFILSSLLLSLKFLNTESFSYWKLLSYFVGRIIRIIPLFIIAVLIYSWMGLFDIKTAARIITLTETWAHFWTIPVEFKFYLLIPAIIYACIRFFNRSILITAVFLIAISATTLPSLPTHSFWSAIFTRPELFHIFFLGILIALYITKKRPIYKSYSLDAVSIFIVIIFALLSPYSLKNIFNLGPEGFIATNEYYLALPFLTALFVYINLTNHGIIYSLLRSKPLDLIGQWSYSIYLFHWLVLVKLASSNTTGVNNMILAVIESIGVGALAYYVIEQPLERWRHHWLKSLENPMRSSLIFTVSRSNRN